MIGIVTTYKDRPNYTTITVATVREALRIFNEGVSFYFYDDASVIPPPPIVVDLSTEPNISGFKIHKNNKSLGAEWGNIDAITRCFNAFPDINYVLVLDNDLCVHPQAFYAIRKMVTDLPKLGFGSLFNSNVFPELEIINRRYVVKEVNPGLGGVISRDAWFWHLDKSKGTKLDKNPRHPGWDWNLSAWMKDSRGRWDVYATHRSFVEHIGCAGTNVSDDFMTRSRRYYDQVEDFFMEDPKIDILMPVKDMSPDALDRMKWCIQALATNDISKFRLCISDASKVSMKETLEQVIGFPFEYYWEECQGLFNRSRVINNGVRHLVKSDPFIVMDTDIIVPSNFLDKFTKYFNETPTFILGRLAYLKSGHPMTDNWSKLVGQEIDFYYNSGFFICSLELFKKANGFDESYDGWGAEDDDFNVRLFMLTKGKMRKMVGMEMTCWHLFHPRKDVIEKEACERNRELYWRNKPKYENGSLAPNHIKGLEDLRR
jgi:hypothetical protein